MELPYGRHRYPFSFTIRDDFPTSVEAYSNSIDSGGKNNNFKIIFGLITIFHFDLVRGCVRYLFTVGFKLLKKNLIKFWLKTG